MLHPSDRDNVGASGMCGTEEESYHGSKGDMPQVEAVSGRGCHNVIRRSGTEAAGLVCSSTLENGLFRVQANFSTITH